ncbi:hypothetical protein I6J40_02535 [Streptomyces californicus]|nr:hypothetical protein I6J40_02535 [Streptomyces californicus]
MVGPAPTGYGRDRAGLGAPGGRCRDHRVQAVQPVGRDPVVQPHLALVLLQPLSGGGGREIVPSRPATIRPRTDAFCAAVYREGRRITAPTAFAAGFSKVAPACSVCWWRDSTSNGGMSIFTGQASKQAPQRVEAYGRE